ncbi:MAG: aminotransferase class I/II-fold pyridoxal phosphate-dependent enzyme [Lewinellaceae bacterium]|nr:aminotransferase class I/II-fold pyridoxal phosphate-dependent enzyme [Phaeodactylibacter sp.]MCB9038709.1 aminotransferase class I/II-fold pyridoxal phosphate-dependent enzyme [Lewinellaceae bacterium]
MEHKNIILEAMPDRSIDINGRKYLYFSGTSYLGMARNEAFQELLRDGLARYGANFGGSRLGNIRFSVFEEAETWLAGFAGAPAALTVSSGSLAGRLLVEHLRGKAAFYFAPGTHPALWGEGDYCEGVFEDWVEYILGEAAGGQGHLALFANSVDPLLVRKNPFGWLQQLPEGRPITMVVDDSHGFGVCGPHGSGVWKELKAPHNVEILAISSLGKALGIPGGLILGSREMIERIWHSPFFGGASPAPPAYLYAMLKAVPLYRQAHQKLLANIRRFEKVAGQLALLHSFGDYPAFYTPEAALAPWLEEKGCLISQFAYPTPEDEPVTRIVLSALHENEDIDYLAGAVQAYAAEEMQ